ncbi:MAG: imidazolonepropionase [Ferruginibacter sp.]|nr:imidazolonepropionase [Ferruginibacter sp.]
MSLLITNIQKLLNTGEEMPLKRGKDLAMLPYINDAFLLIEDGLIADYGSMYELDIKLPQLPKDIVDAAGCMVMPSWCDSHSHIVFAGTRESEFVDKLKGLSYAEIAAKGGGILNSAEKLSATSEDQLFEEAKQRLDELALLGTGALEIKSGYGLSVEGELKMLRVIKKLKQSSPVLIKATFLGAHTYPLKFKEDHAGYLNMIINDMLPAIQKEGLADYIDVFCETGFFSAEDTAMICKAGAAFGLKPKLHVNQLNSIGGIEIGIANHAVSLDHLETLSDHEIKLLSDYPGVSSLLPTAAFFLRMPFQPARKLIDAGAAIALASDFNPGSSPGGNMNFVGALSCIQMKMLPEEVVNAATINGAYAMELQDQVGSISIGKKANIILTKPLPSLAYLFYSFSSNLIQRTMLNGQWIN